jgi:hypothetical protein
MDTGEYFRRHLEHLFGGKPTEMSYGDPSEGNFPVPDNVVNSVVHKKLEEPIEVVAQDHDGQYKAMADFFFDKLQKLVTREFGEKVKVEMKPVFGEGSVKIKSDWKDDWEWWAEERPTWENQLKNTLWLSGWKSVFVRIVEAETDGYLVIHINARRDSEDVARQKAQAVFYAEKELALTGETITLIEKSLFNLVNGIGQERTFWTPEKADADPVAAMAIKAPDVDAIEALLGPAMDDPTVYTTYCYACGGYDNTHRIGCPTK